MYVYMYICMYMYIYTFIYTYACTYLHVYITGKTQSIGCNVLHSLMGHSQAVLDASFQVTCSFVVLQFVSQNL